jgi:hypothetical protein
MEDDDACLNLVVDAGNGDESLSLEEMSAEAVVEEWSDWISSTYQQSQSESQLESQLESQSEPPEPEKVQPQQQYSPPHPPQDAKGKGPELELELELEQKDLQQNMYSEVSLTSTPISVDIVDASKNEAAKSGTTIRWPEVGAAVSNRNRNDSDCRSRPEMC